MTIRETHSHLRRKYNAPKKLSREYLEEQMEALKGWHSDAADIAREAEGGLQDEIEALAGAMVEAEHEAAKKLFTTVYPFLCNKAVNEYEKADPPSHEVSREEIVGMAWPVFVRCLATYDPEQSHLLSYLSYDSRGHFRRYLRSIRDRNDTTYHQRARRGLYRLERRTKTEEGREPTREEKLQVVRDAHTNSRTTESGYRDILRYITSQDMPKRLDRPMSEEGDDLHSVVGEKDRDPVRARDVGSRLAQKLGMEKEWNSLLKGQG